MIEADTLVVHGKVYYDKRLPVEWEDAYYKTVITPGVSDGHMHPQVIDPGTDNGLYRDSYDWIEKRELGIDEAGIRRDPRIAGKLARLTYLRSLLEGTTLIAVTGSLLPNVVAWSALEEKPRTVFLPTTMRRKGWMRPWEIYDAEKKLEKSINDSVARLGIFVHSLRYTAPEDFIYSYNKVEKERWILGIHLSEGVKEVELLARTMKREFFNRIAGVHCLVEDVKHFGINCVSCPATNTLLYNKLKENFLDIDSFGSDWPHLIGSVARHIGLIRNSYRIPLEILLFKLTTGGYLVYGMPSHGDLVAYDEPLEEVLTGKPDPVAVYVAGRKVVEEKRLTGLGYNISDLEDETIEAISEAYDLYASGNITKNRLMSRIKNARRVIQGIF